MTRCAVLNCKNYAGKKASDKIRFYAFPKDPKIFNEWAKVCGKEVTKPNSRICSAHFEDSDYRLKDVLLNVPKYKRTLKEDAIPSINVISSSSAHLMRTKIQIRRELVEEALRSYEQNNCMNKVDHKIIPWQGKNRSSKQVRKKRHKEVQTDNIVMGCPREQQAIEAEAKVRRLKAKLERELSFRSRFLYPDSKLRKLFTIGQIKRMEEPDKQFKWSDEDLAAALALYNVGSRVYRILMKRGFPLPPPVIMRKSRGKLELKSTSEGGSDDETHANQTLSDHTYC